MVAKEGENADAEHGCHKEKEQDVEFGVCVGQLVLGEWEGEQQIQADAVFRRKEREGRRKGREEGFVLCDWKGELALHQRLWRTGGLPSDSSLPISSGKASAQTETRLVSKGGREAAANAGGHSGWAGRL